MVITERLRVVKLINLACHVQTAALISKQAHYRFPDTAQSEDDSIYIISHTSEQALAEHPVLSLHLILLLPVI